MELGNRRPAFVDWSAETKLTGSNAPAGDSPMSNTTGAASDTKSDSTSPPLSRPRDTSESQNHASYCSAPEMEGEEQDEEAICFFTRSSKPVPTLACSGQSKSHFRNLDGQISRPLIARFLASAQSSRTLELSHTADDEQHSKIEARTQRSSSLAGLLPSSEHGVLAVVAPESGWEPAYLVLATSGNDSPSFTESVSSSPNSSQAQISSSAQKSQLLV